MSNFGDISSNAVDFAKSVTALSEKLNDSVEKGIRKACIDLYRAIVEKTPVDTGRAKASWGLTTYHANDSKNDPDGYSINEIATIIDANVKGFDFSVHDDQVIIYNNLEYIEYLENGTSQQAPQGMVAISLSEFTAFFNNAIQKIEGIESI